VTIVVFDEEGDGEWEMIPAPSLLAEPSIPRHSKRPAVRQHCEPVSAHHVLQAGGKGEVFLRDVEVTMVAMTMDDENEVRNSRFDTTRHT
jgi:hypothetical protein